MSTLTHTHTHTRTLLFSRKKVFVILIEEFIINEKLSECAAGKDLNKMRKTKAARPTMMCVCVYMMLSWRLCT